MLFALLGIFCIKGVCYYLNTRTETNTYNDLGVYQDGNCDMRLKKNRLKVIDTWDKNGDYIIKYVRDGNTAINITQKEATLKEKEAIKKNKAFYLRQTETGWRGRLGEKDISGDRYCKVNQPNVFYVKRTIDYTPIDGQNYAGTFYMDMQCNLICPTEEQIEYDIKLYGKRNDDLYSRIINEWNEYVTKGYTNAKYDNVLRLGKQCKKDYKVYTDKINRWK